MKIRFLRYGLFLLVVCGLTGCVTEQEDYISKYCPGSCTVVSGKIVRPNGQPIPGIMVTATWKNLRTFYEGMGGATRKKAVAYTDEQGNYTIRFLLRDDEMEEGNIVINPHAVTSCPDLDCYAYTLYSHELKRDTTYTYDFTLN